jgi:hypothetical protein
MFKSRFIFGGLVFFLLCVLPKSSFAQPTNYIETYKKIAVREMHRSGIPASITLAQGILESSWGNGSLALKANNHFGIKCKSTWTGPTFFIKDDDYKNGRLVKSCFRSYDNAEDSYVDHSEFLTDNPRYERLFTYERTDFKKWAHGLKKCGYATDKKYAHKLINTIKKYKLHQYDLLAEERSVNIASVGASELDKVISQSFPLNPQPFPVPNSKYAPEAFVLPDDYKRGDGLKKFASKGGNIILNSALILFEKR